MKITKLLKTGPAKGRPPASQLQPRSPHSTAAAAAAAATTATSDDDSESDFAKSQRALERENRKLQVMIQSVIPKHLVSKMRDDLMRPAGYNRNMKKYYLEYYESVSILFADIVGFTKISSHCKAEDLVAMLNELVGRFDISAEKNKCLRIRILGDCYYCVSGIPANPERPEPHAKQCVEMGLNMIDILRELAPDLQALWQGKSSQGAAGLGGEGPKPEEGPGLQMRIGIHTGSVLCGIMGEKKLQFDVMSNDVKLANRMEQSGLPGKVHITETTLRQLDADYEVEPANARERTDLDIDTYFVRRKCSPGRLRDSSHSPVSKDNATSSPLAKSFAPREVPSAAQQVAATANGGGGGGGAATTVDQNGRTTLAGSATSLSLSQAADVRLAITEAPADGREGDQWSRVNQVAPGTPPHLGPSASLRNQLPALDTIVSINQNNETVSLLAREKTGPGADRRQQQTHNGALRLADTFSSDALETTTDYHSIQVPAGPVKSQSQQNFQLDALAASLAGQDASSSMPATKRPVGLQLFRKKARVVINVKGFIRTIKPPFADLDALSDSVDIDQINCDAKAERNQNRDVHKLTLRFEDPTLGQLYREKQHHHRQRYLTKFLRHFRRIAAYSLVVFVSTIALLACVIFLTRFGDADGLLPLAPLHAALFILTVANLALVGHLIYQVHQEELNERIDFVLKTRMRKVNLFIFYNILPKHVANYFLECDRLSDKELYSKSYEKVCVIFASVANFWDDFYEEGEVNEHGKGCLDLLNEILSDFDELLDEPQFKMIDKIKTIGTTYMAAVGLCPDEEQSLDNDKSLMEELETTQKLRTMVHFVNRLRETLKDISRNSFHEYKMRVGVNVGPVVAGVIGASKPQYDIWGNTVNVASRMESTCEADKIQVTEDVYEMLRNEPDIKFTCRGVIDVKGKGEMTTYYVDMSPPEKPQASLVVTSK